MKNASFITFFVFLFFAVGILPAQKGINKQAMYKTVQKHLYQNETKLYAIGTGHEKTNAMFLEVNDKNIIIRSGSVEKQIALPEYFIGLYPSRGGAYFAVAELIPQEKYRPSDKHLRIDVYSSEGDGLYTVQRLHHYDDPVPQIIVSDNGGTLILGRSAEGRLLFYSAEGQLAGEAVLFGDGEYDLERWLKMAISLDGNRLAVCAGKRGASPMDSDAPHPSAEPYLFLFDGQGVKQWQKRLAKDTPQNVALSPDGRSIFAAGFSAYQDGRIEKMTRLFRDNGAVVQSWPVLFRTADFSPATGNALLADRSNVYVIATGSGQMTAKKPFPPEQGLISAVRFNTTGDHIFILTAVNRFDEGRFIFMQPALHILTPEGTTVQTLPFPDETFLEPALQIDNDRVFIGFTHHLYKIEKTR